MFKKKSIAFTALSLLAVLALTGCNNDVVSSTSSVNTSSNTSSNDSSKGTSSSSSSSKGDTSSSTSPATSSQDSSATNQKPQGAVDLEFGEQTSDGNQNPTTLLKDNQMVYWNDQNWTGSSVTVNYAYFYENKYYISYTTEGQCQWGSNFQLFYKNTQLDYSKKWAVSFTLTSNTAGTIRVNQVEKTLVVGENNITAEVKHRDGNYADLEIITGTYKDNTATQINAMDFTISNLTWSESRELNAPVFSVSKNQENYVVDITAVEGATKYEGILVEKVNTEEVTPFEIADEATLDLSSLENNKAYKLFMRSVGDGVTSTTSPWSTTYEIINKGTISMQAPSQDTNLEFCAEETQPLNTYYYWNDQNFNGSYVNVSKASVNGNTATFEYSVQSGTCNWGFQIYYKNTNNISGKRYTLSFTLDSTVAGTIKVKGDSETEQTIQIKADNSISITYTEVTANASLHIIVPTSLATSGTLKVINPTWTLVEN